MADDGLFDVPGTRPGGGGSLSVSHHRGAPLAVRMRPRTLDDLVGQQQLRATGSPLRRLVEGDQSMSVLLWGPPGTGKTTIAGIVSHSTNRRFVEISAVSAGVKEVRAAIDHARNELAVAGTETVLFVDEVHRFSKAQQDALLPAVENRWITLVAATTENPFFSVISPLMSRSLLLKLESLTDADIDEVVGRALSDRRGYAGVVELEDEARAHLVRLAGGDARRALTYLEAAASAAGARLQEIAPPAPAEEPDEHGVEDSDESEQEPADEAAPEFVVTLALAETAVDQAAVRYDRDGDQHYDVTSAWIKSMRGSDPDAALHYLARMIEAGEDARFIARRLVVHASEDVGMADSSVLATAVAAAQAVQLVGLPEARLNLAHACVAIATAPKSNAVYAAYGAAEADVRAGKLGTVPPHLRDSHYGGAKRLGHGEKYVYPHDTPHGVAAQQYLPDVLEGAVYYRPTSRGTEGALRETWERVRSIVRSKRSGR